MTSSQTVQFFGFYIVLAALTVIFAPGLFALLVFAPPPTGPYYLVLGIVVLAIGYYYIRLGRAGSQAFVQATVVGRIGVAFGVGLAVLIGALPAGLLVLGLVELLGAAWTGRALKREGFAALNF